jgi:hypothetical protein
MCMAVNSLFCCCGRGHHDVEQELVGISQVCRRGLATHVHALNTYMALLQVYERHKGSVTCTNSSPLDSTCNPTRLWPCQVAIVRRMLQ